MGTSIRPEIWFGDSTRFHRDVPAIGAAPDDWVAARAEFLPNGLSDSSTLVGQVAPTLRQNSAH